ncbi:MAG: hypothetical protein BBJ60_10900 [Desulfobacterales bacterium S7086C20]|nr:MAG: hypothetical protein BBJ60_10900 [Desulfobacterales bacterium S7086C20]
MTDLKPFMLRFSPDLDISSCFDLDLEKRFAKIICFRNGRINVSSLAQPVLAVRFQRPNAKLDK